MKPIGHWTVPVAFWVLELGSAIAPALALPGESRHFSIPQIPFKGTVEVSQGLRGQCRQANQNLFIYRTRSLGEPISSVMLDERVILAEDGAREGWIAVTSPTTGFVQAPYLRVCDSPTLSTPPTFSPAPTAKPNLPTSTLCRRVTYAGVEGVAVRSGPGIDFGRVGGLFLGDRVTVNPAATQLDSQGRQWLRTITPVNGWVSNGFPSFGESNLGVCL